MASRSPALTDPCSHGFEFEYKFTRQTASNGPSMNVSVVSSTNDRDIVDDKAFYQLADRLGIDVDTAEQEYDIDTLRARFHDPPWESFNELKSDLRGLDSVQSVRYEDPLTGTYGPPRFHIRVSSSDADEVADAVNEYYSGLVVEKSAGGNIEVVCSALHADA